MQLAAVYLITSPAPWPTSGQNLKVISMVTKASRRDKHIICWHLERLKVACAQEARVQDLDAGFQVLTLLRWAHTMQGLVLRSRLLQTSSDGSACRLLGPLRHMCMRRISKELAAEDDSHVWPRTLLRVGMQIYT